MSEFDQGAVLGQLGNSEMLAMYQQILKDISAGHPVPTYGGGGSLGPLMYQDISPTLSLAGYKTKHIKFWPKVPKAKDVLKNTVHEYTRQTDYGQDLPFYSSEGGIGPRIDVEVERLFAKCRFMSHIRRVSHPAGLINPIIGPAKDAIEKANWDASRWQLRQIERGVFFGDSSVNPDSIDGLYSQICGYNNGSNVVDMKGQPLNTNKVYEAIVTLIQDKFGAPETFWLDYRAKQDLSQTIHAHVKYDIQNGQSADNMKGGANATAIVGPDGDVNLEPNVFLAADGAPMSGAQGADYPATPTIDTEPTAGSGGTRSVFIEGDAGTYRYKVVAFGSTGDNGGVTGCSAAVTSDPVSVAKGDAVTFIIAAPESNSVVFYRIYRTKPGGAKYFKIAEVRQAFDGPSPDDTTVVDYNEDRPDTGKGFLVEHDEEIFIWRQLAGFTRIPLAMTEQTGLKQPFVYLLYGMLEVMLPSKLWVFKNIGYETAPNPVG